MSQAIHEAHGETVTACPECDNARIRRRNPSHASSRPSQTHKWACMECGAHFDEPVERPMQTPGGRRGLAKRLLEADPDDVGGQR